MNKDRNSIGTLTKFVVFSLFSCVLYTAIVIACAYHGVFVPDILTEYYFKVFGMEIGASAIITVVKYFVQKQKKNDTINMLKENNIDVSKEDIVSSESNEQFYTYGDSMDITSDYYGNGE